jgi:hypothetical protein
MTPNVAQYLSETLVYHAVRSAHRYKNVLAVIVLSIATGHVRRNIDMNTRPSANGLQRR